MQKLEARGNAKLACRYLGRFGLLPVAPAALLHRLAYDLHLRRAKWLVHSCAGKSPMWDLIDLYFAQAAAAILTPVLALAPSASIGTSDSVSASCANLGEAARSSSETACTNSTPLVPTNPE